MRTNDANENDANNPEIGYENASRVDPIFAMKNPIYTLC